MPTPQIQPLICSCCGNDALLTDEKLLMPPSNICWGCFKKRAVRDGVSLDKPNSGTLFGYPIIAMPERPPEWPDEGVNGKRN